MLVLSRKLSESIRIADEIEIKVVAVSRGAVRLGICAPRDIRIVRAEIQDRLPQEVCPRRFIATSVGE